MLNRRRRVVSCQENDVNSSTHVRQDHHREPRGDRMPHHQDRQEDGGEGQAWMFGMSGG